MIFVLCDLLQRAGGVPVGPSTSSEACLPDTSETPPMGAAIVEVQDTEEEEEGEGGGEEDNEGGGLATNGEVPNDVIANKPEAGGGEGSVAQDGVKLVSERTHQKPPYSYAQLIVQALLASKDRRQTLSSIYSFISEMYPYYKLEDKGWKVGVCVYCCVMCVHACMIVR